MFRKNILLGFLLFSFLFMQSQETIDDMVIIPTITSIHKSEREHLDKIEARQQTIMLASTAMGASTTLYSLTEQKLHKRLIRVYDLVDNAQAVLKIYRLGESIIGVQDATYELAQGNPERMALGAYYETVFLKRAVNSMLHLFMATKESRFNLLNNKQRLDLFRMTAETLEEIRLEAYRVYQLMRFMSDMEIVDLLQSVLVDFSDAINQTNEEINNLMILN